MTQSRPLQQAIFPDLPRDSKLVDSDGNINAKWRFFFDQLVTALQSNYKPEGLAVPLKTTSEISQLNKLTPNIPQSVPSTTYQSRGNLVYNSDTNHLYVNLNNATWTLII